MPRWGTPRQDTTPVRQTTDGPSSTEEGSSAAGGSPPGSGGAGALATGVVTSAQLGNFLAARKCGNSRAWPGWPGHVGARCREMSAKLVADFA